MLQMDGSPDNWFGNEKACLISMSDDATSDVLSSVFFPTEAAWGCLTVLAEVIREYGSPERILTDQAGWSIGGTKRESFSPIARACKELGITLVDTPSAESKGRVERLNRHMQYRRSPVLKLYGIIARIDANRYLKQVFLLR
jgi:hypothetical protein